MLNSSDFVPTNGVTYEVTVLKGVLFSDSDRITKKIRTEADRRGLSTPHPEVACLYREFLTDDDLKAMGLWWIVTMHEPIKDSGGVPRRLGAGRNDEARWLDAFCGGPGDRWSRERGFVFVVAQ